MREKMEKQTADIAAAEARSAEIESKAEEAAAREADLKQELEKLRSQHTDGQRSLPAPALQGMLLGPSRRWTKP